MESRFNKTGLVKSLSRILGQAPMALLFLLGLFAIFPGINSVEAGQPLKPVTVGTVLNPMDWEGLYDPGQVVSNELNRYGKSSGGFLWVMPHPEALKKPEEGAAMEEIPLEPLDEKKPVEMKPLPVQFMVQGELLLFRPNVAVPVSMAEAEPGGHYAEIQFHCRVIHYLSGRVAAETVLWSVGSGGTAPFPNSPESTQPGHPDFQKTSMGRAIEQLAAKTFRFLERELSHFPLEAQVLNWDEGLNQVTLNVGARNGVRVSDQFAIFKLIKQVEDPITGADLGDHFKKMGVVRVMETGEGFSEAAVLLGDQFQKGWVARMDSSPEDMLMADGDNAGRAAKQKQTGAFTTPGREREFPRSTFTSLSVFDMFGFELNY